MRYLFIIMSIILVSCNSFKGKNVKQLSETDPISPGNINKTVPYEGSVMLLGKANRTGLEKEEFQQWFKPGYEDYQPNPEIAENLRTMMDGVDIILFMGTWCEDSHRDVPHLYKILDEVDYDTSKMEVYAVSDEKTTPERIEEEYTIIQVPTIIFYKNHKEMGRIVEYSIHSLEQDMYDILSGADYIHPYMD